MSIKEIHGIKVDVQDGDHDSVHNLVKSLEEHEHNFSKIRHDVDDSEMKKIHVGEDHSPVVVEKKDGMYVIRKSN